jgi:hypothetical protein
MRWFVYFGNFSVGPFSTREAAEHARKIVLIAGGIEVCE